MIEFYSITMDASPMNKYETGAVSYRRESYSVVGVLLVLLYALATRQLGSATCNATRVRLPCASSARRAAAHR